MPNTLQQGSPFQHTVNAQYVAEYDMVILNLELQIESVRRKGILSLQEFNEFEENLNNIVRRTNEHNFSSGSFLQGLALSKELMSSRVPVTQGIMTVLSHIWFQGGSHRVRIDRRILELRDLERVVSMISKERVPMYQIYRIIHDHILPKEIDNNAEYIFDVPDVVGYYMNPMDIYDNNPSLRNDLRQKYYVKTGPMIIELIRETLSLLRPDTDAESATLLSNIQNIALTEIVALGNFMYHNPRQHDDTLSCMKTIRNFITSCVNHQTSKDVVKYVQSMLISDPIIKIKYYGISSAFMRGCRIEDPPFTSDIDIPTIKLELQNLGLLVIDKRLGIAIDRSEPFGSGGFGSVYKITTTEDTVKRNGSKKVLVEVVIKEYKKTGYANDEQMLKRFLREARIGAKAQSHPSIISVYACWISNGLYPILVTEYCNGGTFYEFIRKTTSKMSERLKLQLDVAKGLCHLHSLEVPGPIIHGDLKSDNVLINNSRALICDFGISEVHDDRKGLTTENHGSSYYTAPEVLRAISNGKRARLTKESDVYSFGCLYLEVLTGQIPFYGVDLDKLHNMPQSEWWRIMPDQVKGMSATDWHFLSLCWDNNLACRPYMSETIVMLDSKLKQAIREEQATSQKAESKPKPFWKIWG